MGISVSGCTTFRGEGSFTKDDAILGYMKGGPLFLEIPIYLKRLKLIVG